MRDTLRAKRLRKREIFHRLLDAGEVLFTLPAPKAIYRFVLFEGLVALGITLYTNQLMLSMLLMLGLIFTQLLILERKP